MDKADGEEVHMNCKRQKVNLRNAWCNYRKTEVDATRLKGIKKITKDVIKEIGQRWQNLPNAEKVNYDIGKTVKDVRVSVVGSEKGFHTCRRSCGIKCNPTRFKAVVDRLDVGQRNAVIEIGFGRLLELKSGPVKRDLLMWLVDNMNSHEQAVYINNQKVVMSCHDFKRIMGLGDGSQSVDLEGVDQNIEELLAMYCRTVKDRNRTRSVIPLDYLEAQLKSLQTSGDDFKRMFVLFALGCLLCPTPRNEVKPSLLHPLAIVDQIKDKNWGTFCYNNLISSVRRFKQKKQHWLSGCTLFLQLFYFDIVNRSLRVVDEAIPPYAAWDMKSTAILVKLIDEDGGFQKFKVNVNANVHDENIGWSKIDMSSSPTHIHMDRIRTLEHEVHELKMESSSLRADVESLLSENTGLKAMVADLTDTAAGLNAQVGALTKEVKQLNDRTLNVPSKGSCEESHFRSNVVEKKHCPIVLTDMTTINNPGQVKKVKGINKSMYQKGMGKQPLSTHIDPIMTHPQLKRRPGLSQLSPYVSCPRRRRNHQTQSDGFPFRIEEPIALDDEKLLHYVFDNLLGYGETVFRNAFNHMTRLDILSLRPRSLVDSSVITVFCDMMTHDHRVSYPTPMYWYLPIHFSGFAMDDAQELVSFVDRQHYKEMYMNNSLSTCSKIFLPIHDPARHHFYLYVLSITTKSVEVWDSMCGSWSSAERCAQLATLLQSLDMLFAEDLQNVTPQFSFSDFKVIVRDDICQQPDLFSCGIFVMEYMSQMEEICKAVYEYDEHKVRLRLSLRLLNHETNEVKEDNRRNAERYFEETESHVKGGIAKKLAAVRHTYATRQRRR